MHLGIYFDKVYEQQVKHKLTVWRNMTAKLLFYVNLQYLQQIACSLAKFQQFFQITIVFKMHPNKEKTA